jgi:hypothetical protein
VEEPVPSHDRGLLVRLDALVALVADRHGLALGPDGRLAAAEARVAARAAGLAGPPTAGSDAQAGRPRLTAAEREAVELLRAVAQGIGLLRLRGDRLEATGLRHAWAQLDRGLQAGLAYSAWCQQVTFYTSIGGRALAIPPPGSGEESLDLSRNQTHHS